MPMAIMIALSGLLPCWGAVLGLRINGSSRFLPLGVLNQIKLGTIANIDGFLIILMHIVDECQVVESILVHWVQLCAHFQVLYRQSVLLLFEICQP